MTSPDGPQEPQEPQPDGQPQEAIRPAGPLRRHWLWIALAAAVAVAGYAAANVDGGGNARPAAGVNASAPAGPGATGSTGGPPRGAIPNPDATEPVPAAIPSPAGAATSTSTHLSRKKAASLARWKAGRGGAAFSLLSAQMGDAMQSGGLRLYPTMRVACTKVSTAVTAARAGPPIPDAAMQRRYIRALAALARAAADCRAGISVHPYGDEDTRIGVHPRALRRSRAEFATGARDLFLATGKIKGL